jgi:hypothetical protein
LKKLSAEADRAGLKSLSVDASIALAEAMIRSSQWSSARSELDPALARAENLGLKLHQARIHFLLAKVAPKTGAPTEATSHYRDVVRIMESVNKEDGSGRILERADLKPIYRESATSYQGSAR